MRSVLGVLGILLVTGLLSAWPDAEADGGSTAAALVAPQAGAAYNVTTAFEGRVTCAVGTAVLFSCRPLYPATVVLGIPHWNDARFAFGDAADPPVGDAVTEVWVEATWAEEKVALGPNALYLTPVPLGGRIVVFDPADRNAHQIFANGRGDSPTPLRAVVAGEWLEAWGLASGGLLGAELEPQRSYASPGAAFDWEFRAYATVYYNGPADPCWSPALQGPTC